MDRGSKSKDFTSLSGSFSDVHPNKCSSGRRFFNRNSSSTRSTRSNATTLTILSSLSSSNPSCVISGRGKLQRNLLKYEDDISEGNHLGINENELKRMNKHIPALKSHGRSATFRQHYYPEGSWGWVILIVCLLVNIFTSGFQLSFGILYLEIIQNWKNEFYNKSVAIWIGSINFAISLFVSPFVVAFCKRNSIRFTAILGGFVMALSILFVSFARQLHQVFISYGVCLGVGCAMVRETATLMLCQYFKRNRYFVEMISQTGTGLGIAIFSNIIHYCLGSLGWRLGLQVVSGGASLTFLMGLFYRSASLYHPQRRAILHLKDMSKRKGKDKNKLANTKASYFDFDTIVDHELRFIFITSALTSGGAYTPIFFLVPIAVSEGMMDKIITLETSIGLATTAGSIFFGILVISKNQQCLISKQYLLQASIIGLAISLLALILTQGYDGYLLFTWMYGLFLGGFRYMLNAITFERIPIRQFNRGWSWVLASKAITIICFIPTTFYISSYHSKAGLYLSLFLIVLGSICLTCGSRKYINLSHTSNNEATPVMSLTEKNILAAGEIPGIVKCTCNRRTSEKTLFDVSNMENEQVVSAAEVKDSEPRPIPICNATSPRNFASNEKNYILANHKSKDNISDKYFSEIVSTVV